MRCLTIKKPIGDNMAKWLELDDIKEWIRINIPGEGNLYDLHLVVDTGEIVIYYLMYHDSNYDLGNKTVYYNQWYPGEFNVSGIKPIEL